MAKICEYCQQPYPDNLATCPNCDVFGAELVGGSSAPSGTPAVEVDQFRHSAFSDEIALSSTSRGIRGIPDPRNSQRCSARKRSSDMKRRSYSTLSASLGISTDRAKMRLVFPADHVS